MPAGFTRITCSRPWRWRRTRRASWRTRKCLEIAGSEIRKGLASSVTRVPPCPARRSKIRRRVGCARAAKTVVTLLCLLTNVRNIYGKASFQVKKIFNMDVKYYERKLRNFRIADHPEGGQASQCTALSGAIRRCSRKLPEDNLRPPIALDSPVALSPLLCCAASELLACRLTLTS